MKFLTLAALVGIAVPQLDSGNCCCARQQREGSLACCQVREQTACCQVREKTAEATEQSCCCSKTEEPKSGSTTYRQVTSEKSKCRTCLCKTLVSEKTTLPKRVDQPDAPSHSLNATSHMKVQFGREEIREQPRVFKPPATVLYCVWLN